MVKFWVYFPHESCRAMSQLSTSKNLSQLDLSTLSYDQMNEHYLFGHFAQAECKSPKFGQFLGHPMFSFWIEFFHQNCAIMCLILCPIGVAPIEPTQPKL